MKLALGVRETARACSISHRRLRDAIANGELVPHAVGRRSLLLVSDVEAWIKSKPKTKTSRPNGVPCHADA